MASESVKVVVRCRPMNQRGAGAELPSGGDGGLRSRPVLHPDPGAADQPPKQFTFDGAYYMDHFTEQIYNEIAYPLVEVRPRLPRRPAGQDLGPLGGLPEGRR